MRILALLASCTFLYFIADSYLSQLNRQLCHAVIADDHRAGVHQRLEHHRTADDEQITAHVLEDLSVSAMILILSPR